VRIFAQPRDLAELTEIDPTVPEGTGERFCGYGVMGLPFQSGHLLALRRFPASSLGYGYSSVWHRDPAGRWTFWSDLAPQASCARFFAPAEARVEVASIRVRWAGPRSFRVIIGGGVLDWLVVLRATPATLLLNTVAACLPWRAWRQPALLRAMGAVAGPLLGAGAVNLAGHTPNGHRFTAVPLQGWMVGASHAVVRGTDAGEPGPHPVQARLGDFAFPQRGLFVIGGGYFESAEPMPSPESPGRSAGRRPAA
jgi:hypothetical protein